MTQPATHATVPHETHPTAPPSDLRPEAQVSDANGTASAADKEFYRRKGHGGTGA